MKRRYRFAYIAVVLVLMAGAAMPQGRTQQGDNTPAPNSTRGRVVPPAGVPGLAKVAGNGSGGKLPIWTGAGGTNVLGDSIITETSTGRIGIGTSTPGSSLTVRGMIETTLGGLKFPDGTIQTTALAIPLVLQGPVSVLGDNTGVINVTATTGGGQGLMARGGNADSSSAGGDGADTVGGQGAKSSAGNGLYSLGGFGLDHPGGFGVVTQGGQAINGSGGDGVNATGGDASGNGHKAGRGLFAAAGTGTDGATNGLAGEFVGNVTISGNLSKGGGSFKIDHPLDPENKYLYHSFVESPDMMNIYSATVTTDAGGDAIVTLPDWFEALNQDFRYQLTVIGTFAQAIVAQEITGNRFNIKTNAPNVKVCWLVIGTRHDAYANKHRIPVEEQKPADERGLFLHPDAFNQPEEKGVQFVPKTQKLSSSRAQANRNPQQR